jgi:glycosyltransferase involved in cell wall biosynthesis
MSISVVIPLFDKASTVGRSVASALSQTRPADEIVVVDDGSTDGSSAVVEDLRAQQLRLIRQTNAGVSAARNRGIDATSGDLIAFLDADDEWDPGFLAAIERLAQDNPEAGAYATSYLFVNEKGRSVAAHSFNSLTPYKGGPLRYFLSVVSGDAPLNASSTAVRRSALDKVGQFLVGAAWGEDAEMWTRIYLEFPIAYLAEPLARYHIATANRATEQADPRPMMPVVKTLEQALQGGRIRPEEASDAARYICQAISNTVQTNILHGHRSLAAGQLKHMRPYPCGRRTYWRLRALTQLPHWCIRGGLTARNFLRAALDGAEKPPQESPSLKRN